MGSFPWDVYSGIYPKLILCFIPINCVLIKSQLSHINWSGNELKDFTISNFSENLQGN